jgi:hypothetical protein
LPDNLPEFGILADVVKLFEDNIKLFCEEIGSTSGAYSTNVSVFITAINEMPFCIFDVLRARIIFSAPPDTIVENDTKKRIGIRVSRLINKLKEINENIKEDRYYGL